MRAEKTGRRPDLAAVKLWLEQQIAKLEGA
jgi:hypothetical protein